MRVSWIRIQRRGSMRMVFGLLGLFVVIEATGNRAIAQTVPWERPTYRNQISADKRADAKKFSELLRKARQTKPHGAVLSKNDIHKIYSGTSSRSVSDRMARLARSRALPLHRVSIVASPASLLGPLSLGPAYGPLMFQNSINLWPEWQGGALPWNGIPGTRTLLSSGPLTIPYELALQNRVQVTTITDSYGNQLVILKDTASGFSQQYAIIGRLDSVHAPGTENPIYGRGYFVSTYEGQFPGTNTSSFPGVFVPAPPFQTTFGYPGDLDTLGPFGRGNTPLNPSGPTTISMPDVSAPSAGTVFPAP
jgi:hypothetical protein